MYQNSASTIQVPTIPIPTARPMTVPVPWPGWDLVVEGADSEVGASEVECEVAKMDGEDVESVKVDVILGSEARAE